MADNNNDNSQLVGSEAMAEILRKLKEQEKASASVDTCESIIDELT